MHLHIYKKFLFDTYVIVTHFIEGTKPLLSHSVKKLFETFWITTMKNCGYGKICILNNRIETEEYAAKDNLMKPKQIFVKMFYERRIIYLFFCPFMC